MNYAFTKSICIPSGTGSGMVIPVSSLCCCKTEGSWCLFLLFLPSLLFKALLALKSPTPSSERGAQETPTTPLRSSKKRGTQSKSATRGRDRRVRWWWKGSNTFVMRLMDRLNLLSCNVRWRNNRIGDDQEPTFDTFSNALWCQNDLWIITSLKARINTYVEIFFVVSWLGWL